MPFLYLASHVFIFERAVEWLPYCFGVILLHCAHSEMVSVLVLFVTVVGLFQLIGM